MNIYCRSDGVVFHVDPERIFQGSVGANVIRFIGAFPSSAQVLMAYKLPNGVYTSPKMLTPVAELEQMQSPDGGNFSVWEGRIGATPKLDSNGNPVYSTNSEGKKIALYDLDYSITKNYGDASITFYVYGAPTMGTATNGQAVMIGNTMLATATVDFEIEKGVPVIAPNLDTEDSKALLTQMLGVLSNTQTLYNAIKGDVETNTATNEAQNQAIQTLQEGKLDKTGGTVTGDLLMSKDGSNMRITSKGFERNGVPFSLPDGKYGKLVSDSQAVGSVYFDITEENEVHLRVYDVTGAIKANYAVFLPVDNVVVSGFYDETLSSIVLTLKSGNYINVPVGALVNGLISSSDKGVPNGVASLDESGKVPKEQLPEGIGGGGDLSEYVKKTDYATADKAGIVQAGMGFKVTNGLLELYSPTGALDSRAPYPIMGNTMDYAWALVATGGKVTLTNDDYEKFYELLGAVQDYHTNRNGLARFRNGVLDVTDGVVDKSSANVVNGRVLFNQLAPIKESLATAVANANSAIEAKTKTTYTTYTDGAQHKLTIGAWYMVFSSDSSLKICKADGTAVVSGARQMLFMSVPYSETEKEKFVVMGMYFYDGTFSITNPKVPMEFFQIQVDNGSYITASSSATFNVSARYETLLDN